MNHSAALAATFALLAAPGPTNALLALSAAQSGPRLALRHLSAALAAYLAAILVLGWAGEWLFAALPGAAGGLKLIAALWLGVLAVRLWTLPPPGSDAAQTSARQVAATTLLNPKAGVIALALLPPMDGAAYPLALARTGLVIVLAGAIWIAVGMGAARGSRAITGSGGPAVLRRLASGWLALVAIGLLASLGAAGPAAA